MPKDPIDRKPPTEPAGSQPVDPVIVTPVKKRRRSRGKDKAKMEEARRLVEGHGLTQVEAGKILGVDHSTISARLKGLGDKKALDEWKEKKTDIMEAIQAEMLLTLDKDLIKELVTRRGLVDYGILFDKARIQRGEATDIIDFRGFLEHSLAELADKRRALEAQIVDVTPTYKGGATDSVSVDGQNDSATGQAGQAVEGQTGGQSIEKKEGNAEGPHGSPGRGRRD